MSRDLSGVVTQTLPRALFPRTWEILERGVVEGVAPGFVVGVWQQKSPDLLWLGASGQRRLLPSAQPMLETTVFDLASLAKVLATALLVARLVDRGWLSWQTSVASILPDFPYRQIEIRHLLSHTAGYVAWLPFWENLWKQFAPTPLMEIPVSVRQKAMRELVYSVVPQAEPGEKCVYSDLSFLILGFTLEELTRLPLNQAVQKWVWNPMGVQGARFHPVYRKSNQPPKDRDHYAATENCPLRGGVLQGEVHDDNCWSMGGYGGHAGVFARAEDVLFLVRGLFQGFFSPSVLKAMWTRVTEPLGCERTLGWDTPSGHASSAGKLFHPTTVGHLGFTGTSLWIDPHAQLAVTLLSNRVHPTRENQKIKEFRPRFHEAIRLDLGG